MITWFLLESYRKFNVLFKTARTGYQLRDGIAKLTPRKVL